MTVITQPGVTGRTKFGCARATHKPRTITAGEEFRGQRCLEAQGGGGAPKLRGIGSGRVGRPGWGPIHKRV